MTKTTFRIQIPVLTVAGFALVGLIATAQAQISAAQQSAMKSNCRSDFMSLCSGVTPGGKDAVVCLQKNVASLSPACQQAVKSTLPPPPPEPAQAAAPPAKSIATPPPQAAPTPAAAGPKEPTAAQQEAMRAHCRNDFMSHCSGVSPGGKDALTCLQKNAANLSAACKTVVGATMNQATSPARAAPTPAKAAKKVVPPAKPAPTPAAAPPQATAAATPTSAQQDAMRAHCRNDFMKHCSGVSPGGKEAFGCLQQNVATLSTACKSVVSATLVAPPPAGAATAPAAANPPAAVDGPFVRGAALVAKACARDLLMHCPGIAGNGKAVACLKSHAQNGGQLGIRCRAALNVVSKLH
jgi:hypothetical protein